MERGCTTSDSWLCWLVPNPLSALTATRLILSWLSSGLCLDPMDSDIRPDTGPPQTPIWAEPLQSSFDRAHYPGLLQIVKTWSNHKVEKDTENDPLREISYPPRRRAGITISAFEKPLPSHNVPHCRSSAGVVLSTVLQGFTRFSCRLHRLGVLRNLPRGGFVVLLRRRYVAGKDLHRQRRESEHAGSFRVHN